MYAYIKLSGGKRVLLAIANVFYYDEIGGNSSMDLGASRFLSDTLK